MAVQLYVTMKGAGHKFVNEDYVVTNLKWFYIDVTPGCHLMMAIGQHAVPLRATLHYESGVVVTGKDGAKTLLGDTEVMLINGKATFKIKINPDAKVTTEMHEKRNFFITITAPGFNQKAVTPVFKIMVKIDRRMPKSTAAKTLLQVAEDPPRPLNKRKFEGGDENAPFDLHTMVFENKELLEGLKTQQEDILNQLRALRRHFPEE